MNSDFFSGSPNSWFDIFRTAPSNILDLVAYAELGGTSGSYANSTNFLAPGTWATSAVTVQSEATISSLATDQAATVALADQWNFEHQLANIASTLAPPLRKVLFLKAGATWQNRIPLSFGGSTFDQTYLSYRDNAGTRGDAAGTVSVIAWTGVSLTGTVNLDVVLKQSAYVNIGLVMRNSGSGDWSMFDMEWRVVP